MLHLVPCTILKWYLTSHLYKKDFLACLGLAAGGFIVTAALGFSTTGSEDFCKPTVIATSESHFWSRTDLGPDTTLPATWILPCSTRVWQSILHKGFCSPPLDDRNCVGSDDGHGPLVSQAVQLAGHGGHHLPHHHRSPSSYNFWKLEGGLRRLLVRFLNILILESWNPRNKTIKIQCATKY